MSKLQKSDCTRPDLHGPRYTRAMKLTPLLLLGLLGCWSASASAQWMWTDAQGRKVFSDTAPPSSVPEGAILRRPGQRTAAPAADPAATASAAKAAPLAPKPAQNTELEKRKKELEAKEAAKVKEQEDRQAKARAENCERARRSLTTLQGGARIQTTNARGEPEIMGDEMRNTETKRLQGVVQDDCKTP